MARGKSSRKDRERKRRDDEKIQRELELSQEGTEKGFEKQENNEEQELQRLEVEKLQEKQKQETKEKFELLTKDMELASRKRWDSQTWSKYMSCDGRPDIEDPRQVNTFISRWMDGSLSGEHHQDPLPVFEHCDGAIQLIEELDDALCEARHLPSKTLISCSLLKGDLQDAINTKLDQSTLALLKATSMCTDPETGNSYFYGRNETIEMAVWSNLSCNSRNSGMEVKELGLAFVIPRSLVISECAVRFLKLTADSPLLWLNKYPPAVCCWSEGYDDEVVEPPSKLSRKNGGNDVEDTTVDVDEYFVVGAAICVDLLLIPPQPRTIKNWEITRVEDPDTLKRIDWVSDFTGIKCNIDDEGNENVKVDDESEREQEEKAHEELKKLVSMSIKLSEDILWSDVPKLARRDGGNDTIWTTSGLHQITHREDSNTMSFYAARFGTFALLQSRFSSFPYQSWELIPCGSDTCNRVTFTLTTMLVSLEIEIQAGSCVVRQVQSNEKYFLKSLCGHQIKPASLFKRLQAAGIYVTPKGRDCLYTTNIRQKDKQLEVSVYRQIAAIASSYVFSSCRWNVNVGRDKIVIRVRHPDQLADKSKQPVILVTHGEATLLGITELSQTFNERPLDDTSVAGDLCHVVESIDAPTVRNTFVDPLFVDTVFQVLATCGILRF